MRTPSWVCTALLAFLVSLLHIASSTKSGAGREASQLLRCYNNNDAAAGTSAPPATTFEDFLGGKGGRWACTRLMSPPSLPLAPSTAF